RFGIREIWQVDGDMLGTALFFEEEVPGKSGDEPARLERALDALARGWLLRRYPWAGSLSTAHTVAYYDRFGPGGVRELAARAAVGAEAADPRRRALRSSGSGARPRARGRDLGRARARAPAGVARGLRRARRRAARRAPAPAPLPPGGGRGAGGHPGPPPFG